MLNNHYKNILILGTSHIAKESIDKITSEFNSLNPDIVCVELDHKRLHALSTDQKPDRSLAGIRKYGLTGYLFAVIGGIIQQKLGNVVGIKPGSDMLTAVNLAKSNNKQLFLVDQDIEITLKRFSKAFSFKEKFRLLSDVITAPFNKKMKIDLSKVPKEELIHKLINDMKKRYPNLYLVLIDERNQVMAKNIYRIMSKNSDKKILVVIGAGHEKELLDLIKKEDFKRDKIR
ncbi:MAG: TraB/GumN family protein [Candidatus Woesearchaeota archaeon]